MLNHFTACVFLATIFYLANPSNGAALPNSFEPCELGDNVCIANVFTQFVQHPHDYPGLEIPELDPFQDQRPFILQSVELTQYAAIKAYWANIAVYGVKNTTVLEVSGFDINRAVSDMYIKITMPEVKVTMDTHSDLTFGLWNLKPSGTITAYMENVVVDITGKAHNVQRDGKDYIVIADEAVTNQCSSFKVYLHYNNGIPQYVLSLVSSALNTSWRLYKPFLDPTLNRFINEKLVAVFQPMFNKVPLQGFFNMTSDHC